MNNFKMIKLFNYKVIKKSKGKIFKYLTKKELEAQHLKTVILLNPLNEEAILNLAKLKLDSSDYKKSKELNDRLMSLCNNFCEKSKKLKKEIEDLSKK